MHVAAANINFLNENIMWKLHSHHLFILALNETIKNRIIILLCYAPDLINLIANFLIAKRSSISCVMLWLIAKNSKTFTEFYNYSKPKRSPFCFAPKWPLLAALCIKSKFIVFRLRCPQTLTQIRSKQASNKLNTISNKMFVFCMCPMKHPPATHDKFQFTKTPTIYSRTANSIVFATTLSCWTN